MQGIVRKMTNLLLLIFWHISVFLPACFAATKRGYLLTIPSEVKTGTTTQVTLTFFNVTRNGAATLVLRDSNNKVLSSSTATVINGNPTDLVVKVAPDAPRGTAELEVKGEISGTPDYQFHGKGKLYIRPQKTVILIQTDKPAYKPGQKLLFRVFPMNANLQPIGGAHERNVIWIENPSGIRVAQWKNMTFKKGVREFSLPLSKEPVLGNWKIFAMFPGVTTTTTHQQFEVSEYVLPKFEVQVSSPSFVLRGDEEIPLTICAKYTYGLPVRGNLTFKMSIKTFSRRENELPFHVYEKEIYGCYDLAVNIKEKGLHSKSVRNIKLEASVVEKGTGVKQNTTSTIKYHNFRLEIEIDGATEEFRPQLPYFGRAKAKTPNGDPVSDVILSLCADIYGSSRYVKVRSACKNYTTDKDGFAYFVLPAVPKQTSIIELEAKVVENNEIKFTRDAYKSLNPWFSPSNSYIEFVPLWSPLKCGKSENITFMFTAPEDVEEITFNYQVVSSRGVQKTGKIRHTISNGSISEEIVSEWNEKLIFEDKPRVGKLNIIVTPDENNNYAPEIRILLYYVRSDGEVVAGSQKLKVETCQRNQVLLDIEGEQQRPGDDTTIKIQAAEGSTCGLSFLDKSVHLLRGSKALTPNLVLELFRQNNKAPIVLDQSTPDREYCSQSMDAISRPLVLDRDSITSIPIRFPLWDITYETYHHDAIKAFGNTGTLVLSDLTLETRPCFKRKRDPIYYFRDPPSSLSGQGNIHSPFRSSLTTSMFMSTKRTHKPLKRPEGALASVDIRTYFPETWLWELQAIGENGETILKRRLPHTITEWIGNAVCIDQDRGLGVSNTTSVVGFQPFFLSFTIPYSIIRGEVAQLAVTIFNYLSECMPVRISLGDSQDFTIIGASAEKEFCVCGKDSYTYRFKIRAKYLGLVKLTVRAQNTDSDDLCENKITTPIKTTDAITRQLLVEAEGFPKEETKTKYACLKESQSQQYMENFELKPPSNVVHESARAYVSVSGDLMSSALNGLESLVRLPVGCGEQNMVLLAPNIFVLNYLTSTNRVTEELKTKTLNYMQTGYQRELKYRHKDGSYSAFGERDKEGSLWLTAFVAKSFVQAKKFITIDDSDLEKTYNWIVKQRREDGCFHSTGNVLHQAMKGGVEGSDQALTAYVLTSLLEYGYSKNDPVILSGFSCIRSIESYPTYLLALMAYAVSLANLPQNEYLEQLEERAEIRDYKKFWKTNKDSEPNSIDIEIASYALLALMTSKGQDAAVNAQPIVLWLTTQINSQGGFMSTQDTVVGLHALSLYAMFVKSGPTNIQLTVESSEKKTNFSVNDDNRLVSQKIAVKKVPTDLKVTAEGQGCVFIQVTLKYNIPNSSTFDSEDFTISGSNSTADCKQSTIHFCVRQPQSLETPGMSVVDISMISGYVPEKDSLEKLVLSESSEIKRFEVDKNNVYLYFTELPKIRRCYVFNVVQEIVVEEAQPAKAYMYDYYRSGLKVAKNYTLECVPGFSVTNIT
ncbi:pregnancy zone protein-like [Tachypleus tridentatus]|uniref:pregnancy zone protein-like n=1 Tax=Tachypleus tridentatus TaxID=6853 RepID=UPI003FD2A24C